MVFGGSGFGGISDFRFQISGFRDFGISGFRDFGISGFRDFGISGFEISNLKFEISGAG